MKKAKRPTLAEIVNAEQTLKRCEDAAHEANRLLSVAQSDLVDLKKCRAMIERDGILVPANGPRQEFKIVAHKSNAVTTKITIRFFTTRDDAIKFAVDRHLIIKKIEQITR